MAVYGKVAQEVSNFLGAELLRVALAVEVDEAPSPVDIGLLGPIRVVARPNRLTKPIEEAHVATWR